MTYLWIYLIGIYPMCFIAGYSVPNDADMQMTMVFFWPLSLPLIIAAKLLIWGERLGKK